MTESRIAVVTGGARGIGAAICRRLAADGLAVVALDLDAGSCNQVVSDITQVGGRAIGVGADVTSEESVTAAFDEIVERIGAPTILINNAGIIRDNLLFKMTAGDWDAVMNVHLRGAFLMSRAAQRYMTAAKFGRIVNVSSTSALGNRGQSNYSAAKAGLQGFTKTLAIELGRSWSGLHPDRHDRGHGPAYRRHVRGIPRQGSKRRASRPRRPAGGHRSRHLVPR